MVAGEKHPTRALGSRDFGVEKGCQDTRVGKAKDKPPEQALLGDQVVGQGYRSSGRAQR